jgi:hypothetical protein
MWLISSIYKGHVKLQGISILHISLILGPKKLLARGQNQFVHLCKDEIEHFTLKDPNILIVSL